MNRGLQWWGVATGRLVTRVQQDLRTPQGPPSSEEEQASGDGDDSKIIRDTARRIQEDADAKAAEEAQQAFEDANARAAEVVLQLQRDEAEAREVATRAGLAAEAEAHRAADEAGVRGQVTMTETDHTAAVVAVFTSPRATGVGAQPHGQEQDPASPLESTADYMDESRSIPTATTFRTISVQMLDAERKRLNEALSVAGGQ